MAEVTIAGGGLAGMTAAINLAERDPRISEGFAEHDPHVSEDFPGRDPHISCLSIRIRESRVGR